MGFGNKRVPDWHETFVAIARRVFVEPTLTFEEALTALRDANGLQLLAFDEQVRRRGNYWYPAEGHAKSVVRTALDEPEPADAYLFYEACNCNGYVREQALRAMRGHDQRLACAAILIRSQDWVPQVADLAVTLLKDLAASETVRHCFELLDLVVALRSRQRFEPHWVEILEPALLLPKWRNSRIAQLRRDDEVIRHQAHRLVWRADEAFALDAPRMAIRDTSRLIALWALSKISDSADATVRQSLLQEGLRSRLGAVRSDALRRYCRGGYGDVRQVLEEALFDRAASVRNVAAYQLNTLFNESALTRWRAAFDGGNQSEAMVTALSEHGDSEDEARLRVALAAHHGRVRALALRGLLRIGAADSSALLEIALRDSSSRVVAVAIAGFARGADSLTAASLHGALTAARTPGMRARLVSASRLLSKWDRLEFLLAHIATSLDAEREPLDAAIWRWIGSANRSFTAARPEQKLDLRRGIEAARACHPARFWDRVLELI